MSTSFTTNKEIEKWRQKFLDEFGTALNNLNDPEDKGVLNTQSTAKVFDWISSAFTQVGEEARKEEKERMKLKLEVAIEAWMETYEQKQKTFTTDNFIKFLKKELK